MLQRLAHNLWKNISSMSWWSRSKHKKEQRTAVSFVKVRPMPVAADGKPEPRLPVSRVPDGIELDALCHAVIGLTEPLTRLTAGMLGIQSSTIDEHEPIVCFSTNAPC